MHDFLYYARETLEIELNEAKQLITRLDDSFTKSCELLLKTKGRVVISGLGKSGHIGKKITASLASTGTPAFFVHLSEALHGDLGMIKPGDTVILISYSGRVRELDIVLPLLKENRIPIIAITGNKTSPLAEAADYILDIHVNREACPIGLAPTSSTVNTLMMGDALTIALMRARDFTQEDFARSHPGGSLGAQLLNRVYHLMRTGDKLPKLTANMTIMDAMLELSRTGMGLIPIVDNHEHVIGVFTDGDLRRLLLNGGTLSDPLENVMTKPGYQLLDQLKAGEALRTLHDHNINAAPVVDKTGKLIGIINSHDLNQAGIG